jgi:hypothetical protein
MKYRYTTKEGQFETNDYKEIPFNELHSLNDEPSYENLLNGWKEWYFEGKIHRETGPAQYWSNGNYDFWLNHIKYENVNSWLRDNPNKEIEFQAFMRLKYT